jgi:hypothetical protein
MQPSFSRYRCLASAVPRSRRAPKEEGSIAAIFTSLTGEEPNVLPERFTSLKRDIFHEGLVESWREVLGELGPAVEEISILGSDVEF